LCRLLRLRIAVVVVGAARRAALCVRRRPMWTWGRATSASSELQRVQWCTDMHTHLYSPSRPRSGLGASSAESASAVSAACVASAAALAARAASMAAAGGRGGGPGSSAAQSRSTVVLCGSSEAIAAAAAAFSLVAVSSTCRHPHALGGQRTSRVRKGTRVALAQPLRAHPWWSEVRVCLASPCGLRWRSVVVARRSTRHCATLSFRLQGAWLLSWGTPGAALTVRKGTWTAPPDAGSAEGCWRT
jgi:hypothetical protein